MRNLFIVLALCACAYAVFTDVTVQAGVQFEQQPFPIVDEDCVFNNCIPDSMTGSAAVGDYNNDGLSDFFVGRQFGRDILYRNNGDGTFSDVSNAAGLGMTSNHRTNGVLWCDVDNDNDVDLYVVTLGSDEVTPNGNRYFLYMNNGDGTFSEEARQRGIAVDDGSARYGTSATCGDFNNDGWLDIHVNQWDQSGTGITIPHTLLFENTGNGNFEDVSQDHDFVFGQIGVSGQFENNFSSTFVDIDRDGDQDLLISGDFGKSQYYENRGAIYHDITAESMCCDGDNDMGTAFGDLDKNGYLDWFVTSVWEPDNDKTGNRMFFSDGSNVMVDATDLTNTREADWGWGANMLDIDNDADVDVIATNGQYYNKEFFVTDRTRLWENVDGEGNNMPERATEWGITDNGIGKCVVSLDYDQDGDLDVIIAQTGPGVIFYRNDINNDNDWIRIKTPGTMSNAMGIGAHISVWPSEGDKPLYQEMGVGGHYQGHSENTIAHFGVGDLPGTIFQVEVHWPVSGQTVTMNNVEKNRLLVIEEPMGQASSFSSFSSASPVSFTTNTFTDDNDSIGFSTVSPQSVTFSSNSFSIFGSSAVYDDDDDESSSDASVMSCGLIMVIAIIAMLI